MLESQELERVRRQNAASVEFARDGVPPDSRLLEDARRLGSKLAVAECQISVVAMLACIGRPLEARERLDEVRSYLDDGLELDERWQWRFENCCGLVADDFGEVGQAWLNHRSSLEMALAMDDQHLVAWSRLNLAKASEHVGLYEEAEDLLTALLGASGAADGVRMNAHLILAHLVARAGSDARAKHHRGKAEALWSPSTPRRYRRMLVETALWMFDSLPDHWASEYAGASGSFLSEADNNLGGLEAELLSSRLDFFAGNCDAAIAVAQSVIDRSDEGLAVTCVATFTLATFFNGSNQFERALEVLQDQSLNPPPSALALRVVEERRRAYEGLGQWKEAASCFDAIVELADSRSQDVLTVIEIQRRVHESALIEKQNDALQAKNTELETVARDKDAIMNMIANHLQSPLTALQLTLRLLRDDLSADNVVRRVGSASRTIRRMETLAEQLSLAGEIESGAIRPVFVEVPLEGLVDRVVSEATNLASAREMTIVGRVEQDIDDVHTDAYRLQQILSALVWGVTEFSPSGSRISISVSSTSSRVVSLRVDGPDLELSLESLDRMGQKWGRSSVDSMTRNMCSDLSFYTAEKLGEIIGTPVCIEVIEPGGVSFVLELPAYEKSSGERPILM